MAIFWRVWATSVVVVLAVLIVFLALSTFQFSRVHSSLVGERLVVLADRTAAPFEAAARLGLPVADVRNAAGLLERARQTDDRISAIFVFDKSGDIVHQTTGAAERGPAVAAIRDDFTGVRDWHGATPEGFVAGVNFANLSGQAAGGVAVLYPRGGSTTRVWAMAAELSLAALGILCLSALIAGLLLRVGLRREVSGFDDMDGEIAAFETDTWRGTIPADEPTGLRAELDAAYDSYRDAVGEIRRAEAGAGR